MMDTSVWATGDLLAFMGHGFYDWLIQLWTHSPYTHVGMLDMTIPKEPMLIQATPERGVAPMLVSRAMQEEGGRCFWVSVNHLTAMALNPEYQGMLLAFMRHHEGDHYDWGGIAHFVLPFFKQRKNQEFCSELVAEAFAAAGLMQKASLSPGNLIAKPIFLTPVEV